MSTASTTREDTIKTVDEAYKSLREYVQGIAESDMLKSNRVGIWSGRDLVIHLAVWESQGARILDDLSAGRDEVWLPEGVSMDEFNEARVRDHPGKSLLEALDFWRESHDNLLATYRGAGVEREDVLMEVTRDHYRQHVPDFRHVKPFRPLDDDARAILLEEMDASHQEFLALLGSMPDEMLLAANTVGIWSGKDLISHLGHWQEAAIALIRELENDRPGKWPGEDGSNINEWNEARVNDMADLSLAEIRAYQQDAYERLRDLIASSTYATRSAGIGATQFHYGLHRGDFESLR